MTLQGSRTPGIARLVERGAHHDGDAVRRGELFCRGQDEHQWACNLASVLDNVTRLPSIQQEQQPTTGSGLAPEEDVDSYVDRVSDAVLTCRQRGRHLWPAMKIDDQPFTAVDEESGLFVRRLTCTCCALAVRVEKWQGTGRGRRVRFELVNAHLEYLTGPDGETYLAPSGSGRMTPRQIGASVASKAMQGQSLAALRKALPRT